MFFLIETFGFLSEAAQLLRCSDLAVNTSQIAVSVLYPSNPVALSISAITRLEGPVWLEKSKFET